MVETCEFRIAEESANLLFDPSEGKRIGDNSIRLVEVATDDPKFKKIGELQKQLDLERGEAFFTSWQFKRRYSSVDMKSAELFHMTLGAVFEPAGEECGTVYDESKACTYCGVGGVQTSVLKLDLRKFPKSKDFAATIADEWIVS